MTEEDRVQFKFMIPSILKMRLEKAARDKRRSLSAEIIERLEQSFGVLALANDEKEFRAKLFDILQEQQEIIERQSEQLDRLLGADDK